MALHRPLESAGEFNSAALEILDGTLFRRTTAAQPPGMRSAFRLSRSGGFNARVLRKSGGADYVVTCGALWSTLDICMQLASDAGFSRKYDSGRDFRVAEGERPAEPGGYDFRRDDAPLLRQLRKVPVDPSRQEMGWQLFRFALRFLSLHEQGHYLQGHLHMLGLPAYWEFEEGLSPDASEERRALEIHADCFGIRNLALYGVERWDEMQEDSGAEHVRSAEDWLTLSFLGTLIVLLQLSGRAGAPAARSHPSREARLYAVLVEYAGARQRHSEGALRWDAVTEEFVLGVDRLVGVLGDGSGWANDVFTAFAEQRDEFFVREFRALALRTLERREALAAALDALAPEVGGPLAF